MTDAPPREGERHPDMGYDSRLRLVGAGPPLVYVPGMDGTGLLFYRQLPSLAPRFTVATYRLRDAATRMETLVDDLAVVCRAAGTAPAIVVGESFGGALAMSFALAHPDRVRALVVLNSFPYFGPQRRLALGARLARAMPWGVMGLVRRITARRLHAGRTSSEDVRAFFQLTRATTREGYVNRLAILRRYDVREALRRLEPPTLFLAADRDRLIPSVEQARLMASVVPRATIRILAGFGHSCFLADGIDLAELLAGWMPSLGAAPDATPLARAAP